MKINEADWKNEKHMPIISLSKEQGGYLISVEVGKEIPHPNTYEHHISWIEVFFEDNVGNLFPIGRATFDGHGESGFTDPKAVFFFKPSKQGKIVAFSFCNIHGLWKAEKEI